jgi:hypothetical protein
MKERRKGREGGKERREGGKEGEKKEGRYF